MHVLDAFVDHVGAPARDVVDDTADRLFVSGNRPRRQHHRVVGANLDITMVGDRDPRER
jgi:hypothetical protein